MKRSYYLLSAVLAFSMVEPITINAHQRLSSTEETRAELSVSGDTVKAGVKISKEEKNRNVMLNAESSTAPRTVNIGIPISGDLVIQENDAPVVYYFYPTIPTAAWRRDNSIGTTGLSSFAETAIRTGKVGLAVETSDRHASRKLSGYASIYGDNFGSSRYDVSLTGPLSKKHGLGFMVDFYHLNERSNGTNWKFTPWKDNTTMLKFALEKTYKNGWVRLLYKMVDFKFIMTNYCPLIYEGDGKTSEFPGFSLGKDAFIIANGMVPYYDSYTGEPVVADLSSDKFLRSVSHTIYLNGQHRFKEGFLKKWQMNYTLSFMHDNAPNVVNFPISLMAQMPDQQGKDKYSELSEVEK